VNLNYLILKVNSGAEIVAIDTHSQLDVSRELPAHVLENDHHPPLWAKEEFHFPASKTSTNLRIYLF